MNSIRNLYLVMGVLIAIGALKFLIFGEPEPKPASPETERKYREMARKEDLRRKADKAPVSFAKQCLRGWDGSHPEFKKFIKENLKDPSSFKHEGTSIVRITPSGDHVISMKYSGTNAFGARLIETASAIVNSRNCDFQFLSQR